MQITFEAAGDADAEALVQIQIAAFHHDSVLYPAIEPSGPPGYDSVEQMRRNIAQHPCYKIVADGHTIGVLILVSQDAELTHLDVIAIHPAYHNRGIGTLAMQFLEQAHPARRYTLDTPSWAVRNQHFYTKLGYVKVGETTYPDITLFAYEKRSVLNR
jgi:GNAT superfamily N-acetyltransferase